MKSFDEIYEQIYKENINELQMLKNSRIKRFIIALILGVVAVIIGLRMSGYLLPYMFITVMMILIFSIAFRNGKYIKQFKTKAIAPFIKNVDENLNYYHDKGLSQDVYREGKFEGYDTYSSDDLIAGILDNKYAIKMAEVHTQIQTTDKEGRTTYTTVFHGIFGNVGCSKNINTMLKIHSNKGFLGKIFKKKTRLEMDSTQFEKYFDVDAENKMLAMQILTSDVMSMMIDFVNESKIKYEITIIDKQIYIRFHTGRVFEPRLFKNALDRDTLKRYYDIIEFIFKVSRGINTAIENTQI